MKLLTTKLRFKLVETNESICGCFEYPNDESWKVIHERFIDSYEKYQSGYFTEEVFIFECKAILKKNQNFLMLMLRLDMFILRLKIILKQIIGIKRVYLLLSQKTCHESYRFGGSI